MEQTQQSITIQSGNNGGPFPSQQAATGVVPECGCGGAEGNSTPPQYVYVIGNLRPAYPSISLEKAFQWAVGAQGMNSVDYTLQYQVMSQAVNIAVSKQVCWIMQVGRNTNTGSADTYLVLPRSYSELYNMIDSIQPDEEQASRRYDVVIGPRGPVAPPEVCNGLQLPMLICNQFYSFTFDEFVGAAAAKVNVGVENVGSMFYQLMQLADNAGETDEHRALNYVTLRYPEIYVMAANMAGSSSGPYSIPGSIFTLQDVVAKLASVQGARRIVDIIFRYTERQTQDSVYWYTQVDTTGQFPFLVRPLSRYYPHP